MNIMPISSVSFYGKPIVSRHHINNVRNVATNATDKVNFTNVINKEVKNIIIMLGAPNSGKGTYAREISAKYKIPQISTGDILRAEVKMNTELGEKAKNYMNSGLLVPDSLIMDIFSKRISQADCKNGFILDGFPRNVEQAKALDEVLKKEKNVNLKIINLDVAEPILYERSAMRYMCSDCSRTYSIRKFNADADKCECGGKLIKRKDDTPEILTDRLKQYKEQSLPLLGYYVDKVSNIKFNDKNAVLSDMLNKIFTEISK